MCASPPSPRHAQPDWMGGGLASRQMMQARASVAMFEIRIRWVDAGCWLNPAAAGSQFGIAKLRTLVGCIYSALSEPGGALPRTTAITQRAACPSRQLSYHSPTLFILRWMTARNGSPQKHPLRRPLKEKSPARAASSPKPDEKAAYDWSKHAHQYTVKWPDRITQLHSLHPLLLSPARSLAASPSWAREYGSPSPLPAAISRESTARTRESRSASCAAFNEPSRSGTPTQMLLGSRGRAPDMAGEPMKHSLRGSHLGDSPASDSALLSQLTSKIQEQAFSLLRYVSRSCVGPHRTHRCTFHAARCATGSAKTTRRRSHTSTSATQRYGCSRRGTRCLCTT